MFKKGIDLVLQELSEEGHPPMVAFATELGQQSWASALDYDLSMLRLWICRTGVGRVQLMVAYADGRGGGKPLPPFTDAYEVTVFDGGVPTAVSVQDLQTSIVVVRRWLEGRVESS